MSTTIDQVRAVFARYVGACEALGLLRDGERLVLTEGSKTYGCAYRVNLVRPGSGAHYRPPAGDDFLGMTKAEAFERLADRAGVLEDVAAIQRAGVAR